MEKNDCVMNVHLNVFYFLTLCIMQSDFSKGNCRVTCGTIDLIKLFFKVL